MGTIKKRSSIYVLSKATLFTITAELGRCDGGCMQNLKGFLYGSLQQKVVNSGSRMQI